MLVVDLDVIPNGHFKFTGAAEYTTSNLFFGKQREPALHQIDPGSSGRGKVQMKTRPFEQPALDGRRFMRPLIVQNEMNVQRLGHRLIDPIEKLTELHRPMTTMKLADDCTALDFECSKQ